MRLVIVAGLMVVCASPAAGQSKPPRELGPGAVALTTESRA